eukprot:TRINITY_DN11639_c0_g1_i1.p3 TRINITY_DN11639_c0_g1~~TRINITY_DN11639_c0_g1_i1.p3  ORF type:complete len:132 (+),score=25.42 TRINITY_DN11639_c0_g1_i1:2397-2792(+)
MDDVLLVDDNDDDVPKGPQASQRAEAAIHYTVNEILKQIGRHEKVAFSKPTVAIISKLVVEQSQIMAQDLQAFAKHGKRTTIQPDDVKLFARRRSSMVARLDAMIEEQTKNRPARKKAKSSDITKRTRATI